ncbi:MmgE/PrpD family protein [Sphingosinithalassobacter sp. CS137]|uniref:MmgE/PrpD family protein n=1 Tax=Sphingosinithalassobacter sp. CS137 TaxID=2762748 RepID=UPI00165DE848|nr:MmgE/PrpD family protein [Sphingosinithalassobacter sp. CS137]
MPEATPRLSETLCRHIAETPFSALSPATVAATRRVLLDATGVTLAASGASPDIQPFVRIASAGPGPSAILGTGKRVQPAFAALANGAMAHALDFEDAFDPAPSHPNASMVPAALALAQAHRTDGETLLTALAIGCDLVCRMALSLRQTMEESGWYPPPILGAFGAAAACARVLGLDWRRTRDALSLILCQTTMPGEIKYSGDTVIRAVREAFPAQAAVLAAQLAREGVAGFDAPLEGKGGFFRLYVDGHYDPAVLTEGLGTRFYGEQLSFKPWPACRGTHAFIELAGAMAAEHGSDWRDIESIVAHTDPVHRMLCEPLERKAAPAVAIDAKFSIPFTIATRLVRGRVTLDDFDAAALADPEVRALAARIVPREDPAFGWRLGSGGALTITMRSGERFHREVRDALGCPDRPLSDAQLVEKFVDCAGRAERPCGRDEALALADAILTSDTCDDIGALFA